MVTGSNYHLGRLVRSTAHQKPDVNKVGKRSESSLIYPGERCTEHFKEPFSWHSFPVDLQLKHCR